MSEHQVLVPIELNDDELAAVSGGSSASISQTASLPFSSNQSTGNFTFTNGPFNFNGGNPSGFTISNTSGNVNQTVTASPTINLNNSGSANNIANIGDP